MQRIRNFVLSGLPIVIIGSLLYAGLFIKPQPVGQSVNRPVIERGDAFYGLSISPGGQGWAVGSEGKILRTDDAGKTWQLQRSGTNETLQDVAAWDARRAVVVGNEGIVLKTEDAGRSWLPVDVPKSKISNKLVRVRIGPDKEAWAVGAGGVILKSGDYGQTWASVGDAEDAAWNDITFFASRGCAVGEFGRIRISSDAGATWKQISTPNKVSLMAVKFRNANDGVAVGLSGTILTTSDGGETWVEATHVTPEHLFDIVWDGQRWVAVGDKGIVLIGTANADAWRVTRFAATDRNWYTKIEVHDGRYYVSGSTIGIEEQANL